jgi:Protein of unknown function (DUF3040)
VALSDEEQRLLEQMEAALAAEDPKLVNALRGTGVRRVHRRRAARAGSSHCGYLSDSGAQRARLHDHGRCGGHRHLLLAACRQQRGPGPRPGSGEDFPGLPGGRRPELHGPDGRAVAPPPRRRLLRPTAANRQSYSPHQTGGASCVLRVVSPQRSLPAPYLRTKPRTGAVRAGVAPVLRTRPPANPDPGLSAVSPHKAANELPSGGCGCRFSAQSRQRTPIGAAVAAVSRHKATKRTLILPAARGSCRPSADRQLLTLAAPEQ